jgi:hypothetical protein
MSKPLRKTKTLEESELEPWKLCRNAMRSHVRRNRYSTRVANFFLVYQNTQKNFRTKSGDFCKKMKKTTRGIFPTLINAITVTALKIKVFTTIMYLSKSRKKLTIMEKQNLKNIALRRH